MMTMSMMKMMMTIFVVVVVDEMMDNDGDDGLKIDDANDDWDDVDVMDEAYCLEFVNSNTYVEMDEDLVVLVLISLAFH